MDTTASRPNPPATPGREHADTNLDVSGAPTSPRGRGRGRGRGEGRGRGRRGGRHNQDSRNIPNSNGRPPGGSFGARLTDSAPNENQDDQIQPKSAEDSQAEVAAPAVPALQRHQTVEEDAEVCFICASPIEHISITPCNHQTCSVCSLRWRALWKTRNCPHCRTEAPFVVFTDDGKKRFEEFDDGALAKIDHNLGIKYEKDEILEDTILLLRYNCPDKDCDIACLGWPDLHRHVRSKHGKIMCDLCTRNKKVFTHEHELFTFGELRKHERDGDDRPGTDDQSGFRGHPECGHCKRRFYGDDELYQHCREFHERCYICEQRTGGRNPQYFLNYEELEKHFAADHYVCLDAECQANKTNVFASEMDLKAHQLSQHPNGLSKDARRDARLVNLSGFNIREQYSPVHERRGGGRNRERNHTQAERERGHGRGRDPNAEPLPMSSAQPQSRAELAYQRQMAIQSSQSVQTRTFGGQLSQPNPAQASSSRPTTANPAALGSSSNPIPELDTLEISPAAEPTPEDRARHLKHNAVVTRATTLLSNNSVRLNAFRNSISSYRRDQMSASDLVTTFNTLFDCPPSELGKIVRELADLFEAPSKRTNLLEAWNSWRSNNVEDYPSLPTSTAVAPSHNKGARHTYAGATSAPTTSINLASSLGANVTSGRRVLKLKSSTAASRTAASSSSRVPGYAPLSTPAALQQDSFPALSSSSRLSRQGNAHQIWTGSAPNTTSTHVSVAPRPAGAGITMSNRTNPASTRLPATMSTRQNESMFPSLPKSSKPLNTMISGLNTKGTGRLTPSARSGASTPRVTPWGAQPTPGEAAQSATLRELEEAQRNGATFGADGDDETGEGTLGKGKKKRAKKYEALNVFG